MDVHSMHWTEYVMFDGAYVKAAVIPNNPHGVNTTSTNP